MKLPILSEFSSPREFLFLLLHPRLLLRKHLDEATIGKDPVEVFSRWFKTAKHNIFAEFPDSVCLATADTEGHPDCRMVLLKSFDDRGFVFFTNTLSAKGRDLTSNPHAALTFFWPWLQWQVRIRGQVSLVAEEEANTYFATRPYRSRIAALASNQSEEIPSRKYLEEKVISLEKSHRDAVVRPEYWSGFRLSPSEIEFWQLGLNRLHDRLLFTRDGETHWKLTRLSP